MPTEKKNHSRAPEGDYERVRREKNKRYTDEYRAWFATLPPAEQARLREQGLAEPSIDTDRVSGHAPGEDRDAAESNRACVSFQFAPDTTPAATTAEVAGPDVLVTIQRIAGMLISEENPKLSVAALAFALNLDALNGLGSIREYAAKIGVSPEALSKKKREWEAELHIPPNAFAKTATAKLALSIAQQTKHWKKKKWAPTKSATTTA